MKRHFFILLSALLVAAMILPGCGSSKGYSGGKQQEDETARIEGGTHKLKVKKRNTSEQALLVRVDSLTVTAL